MSPDQDLPYAVLKAVFYTLTKLNIIINCCSIRALQYDVGPDPSFCRGNMNGCLRDRAYAWATIGEVSDRIVLPIDMKKLAEELSLTRFSVPQRKRQTQM